MLDLDHIEMPYIYRKKYIKYLKMKTHNQLLLLAIDQLHVKKIKLNS